MEMDDVKALWNRNMGRRQILLLLASEQVIPCLQCRGRYEEPACSCGGAGSMTVGEALAWVDCELDVLAK